MRALISQRRIRSLVERLARQIDRACHRQGLAELTVVCVLDGAFVFAADLVRALRTPTRIVFCKAASYRGTRPGALRSAALPAELRGRAVLIVDTIYDTGATIARVVRQTRRLSGQVWLAVLIEKRGKAPAPLREQADVVFTGLRVAGDPFLVGYGLDVDGEFRNLPGIRVFQSLEGARPVRPRRAPPR